MLLVMLPHGLFKVLLDISGKHCDIVVFIIALTVNIIDPKWNRELRSIGQRKPAKPGHCKLPHTNCILTLHNEKRNMMKQNLCHTP